MPSSPEGILDIDVQGAKLVNAAKMNAFFVFIQPPSFPELERRLRGRGTESEEKVQLRLKNAHKELESLGLVTSFLPSFLRSVSEVREVYPSNFH